MIFFFGAKKRPIFFSVRAVSSREGKWSREYVNMVQNQEQVGAAVQCLSVRNMLCMFL